MINLDERIEHFENLIQDQNFNYNALKNNEHNSKDEINNILHK